MLIEIINAQNSDISLDLNRLSDTEYIINKIIVFTVLLTIIFIIRWWILIIMSWWDDSKANSAIKWMKYAVIWLIVILLTIMLSPQIWNILWIDLNFIWKAIW